MKKILLLFMSLVVVLGFSANAFAVPGSITLNSITDASGDYTDGISMFFEAGTYEVSVLSGAWNPWSGSTGVTGCDSFGSNCDTGWIWSMDIFQESTSTYYRLGSKLDKYETDTMAYNAHSSDILSLNQASDSNLWFFIKDGNPGDGTSLAWDNSGSVTASISKTSTTINPAIVPEPVSSLLFLIGGATLGFRRFYNKKQIS